MKAGEEAVVNAWTEVCCCQSTDIKEHNKRFIVADLYWQHLCLSKFFNVTAIAKVINKDP